MITSSVELLQRRWVEGRSRAAGSEAACSQVGLDVLWKLNVLWWVLVSKTLLPKERQAYR